uniref:Dickkopf N-terminal cysteine-rich domain-containing protein n=1 Tax=Electrophorus electricus TaxID=8005 RepID=A0A4W4H3D1_ELEEL
MSTAPRLLCVLCVYVCVLAAQARIWAWMLSIPYSPPEKGHVGPTDRDTETPRNSSNGDTVCGFSCDRHFGLCVPLRQEGGYCRRDAQCVRGLGCMFGRCIRRIPEGQEGKGRNATQISLTCRCLRPALCFPLFLGARCKVDKDCEASMCCARHHGERVCKQRLALGESCFVPDGGLAFSINQICPCQEGLLCRGNGMEFVYYPELNNWTCQVAKQ